MKVVTVSRYGRRVVLGETDVEVEAARRIAEYRSLTVAPAKNWCESHEHTMYWCAYSGCQFYVCSRCAYAILLDGTPVETEWVVGHHEDYRLPPSGYWMPMTPPRISNGPVAERLNQADY